MARCTLTDSLGSWSVAVMMATGCASAAMVATAAVSVLSDEQVSAAGDQYGQSACTQGRKRAVRAVDAPGLEEPFPDACTVKYVPLFDSPIVDALQAVGCSIPSVRPLHEAVEVPENFI